MSTSDPTTQRDEAPESLTVAHVLVALLAGFFCLGVVILGIMWVTSDPPKKRTFGRMTVISLIPGVLMSLVAVVFLVVAVVSSDSDTNQPEPRTTSALVRIPGVVGARSLDARATIELAGFSVTTESLPNDQFGEGLVFEQSPPAGDRAREGSVVVLRVSAGP